MKEKTRVCIWTIAAAVLFGVELMAASLTPAARIGNGTTFNSIGMYYNLLISGFSYLIPLILYLMNVKSMKYVIAVVNGLWIICHPFVFALAIRGAVKVSSNLWDVILYAFMGLMAVLCFVVSILWYQMCRKPRRI